MNHPSLSLRKAYRDTKELLFGYGISHGSTERTDEMRISPYGCFLQPRKDYKADKGEWICFLRQELGIHYP